MTIEEQRRARLAAKLKELGDYGVKRRTVEESPFFDPPVELELERSTPAHPPEKADEPKEEVIHPRTKADKPKEEVIAAAPSPPAPRKAKSHKEDLAAFRETYLHPARISHRKAVYVSDETQQRLDFVVRQIGLRGTSISGYVERVLREHLDGYTTSNNGGSSEHMCAQRAIPSRTLACIECKCSGYGHLLFWGPARCVFVPQKPFCATKRLAPGAFTPPRFGSKVAT